MLVFAYRVGGVAATGLVAAIQLVPAAAAAPFVGALGDRVPRERVLFGGYLIQAVCLGATGAGILLEAPVALVYALAAAGATSDRRHETRAGRNAPRTIQDARGAHGRLCQRVDHRRGQHLPRSGARGSRHRAPGPGLRRGTAAGCCCPRFSSPGIRTASRPPAHSGGVIRDAVGRILASLSFAARPPACWWGSEALCGWSGARWTC